MDSQGLYERRFLSKRIIPWSDVVLIHERREPPASDYVEVFILHASPKPGALPLLANPSDRARFLAALQRYVPQARIED